MNRTVKRMIPKWLKSYTRGIILKYRQATWSNRCLPQFIIIGSQKSGTTSLYNYLSQHPQLVPSYRKEVHFFDGGLDPRVDTFKKGKTWYYAYFPLRKKMSVTQQTFEASPLYIFNPLAPQRIADLIPKVKIICLLRNPTERAISHYFHVKRSGREHLPIEAALQKEESRLKQVIEAKDYKSEKFIHNSYKRRGIYKEQLERYFNFFPRQQILVMSSEEFFAKPEMSLKRIFEFIGVDGKYKVADLTPKNVGNNRSAVASNVYDYLDSFFMPHNHDLYEMLGENYGW